jgi:hypothetical protein
MKTIKSLLLAAIVTLTLSTQVLASALTLRNEIPAPGYTAEFRVLQGNTPIARVGVKAEESATVPTSNCYKVQAVTTMGNFTLTSNAVTFCKNSVNLRSQVVVQSGFFISSSSRSQAASLTLTVSKTPGASRSNSNSKIQAHPSS